MNSVHGRVDVVFALQDVGEKLKQGSVKLYHLDTSHGNMLDLNNSL